MFQIVFNPSPDLLRISWPDTVREGEKPGSQSSKPRLLVTSQASPCGERVLSGKVTWVNSIITTLCSPCSAVCIPLATAQLGITWV